MSNQQKSSWPEEWPSADKFKRRQKSFVLIIASTVLVLISGAIWLTFSRNQEITADDCYTLPDPTSAWLSSIFLTHSLPLAKPGDNIPLNITGGYGVQGDLVTICGRSTTRESTRTDIQVGDQRLVEGYLNDQFLIRVRCADPCLLTVQIPHDTPAGTHQLTFRSLTANQTTLAERAFSLTIE